MLLGEIRLHKMDGIVKAEHQDAQAEAAPAGKQRTVFLYDGFGKVPPAKHAQQIQQVLGFLQLAVALHSGCQRSLLLHEVFKNMREPGDLIRFLRGRHAAQLGGALYQYGKRAGGILCQHIRKAEARHRDESCQQHKAENSCERRLIILPEIQGLHHLDTVILQLVAKYGLAGKAFRPDCGSTGGGDIVAVSGAKVQKQVFFAVEYINVAVSGRCGAQPACKGGIVQPQQQSAGREHIRGGDGHHIQKASGIA